MTRLHILREPHTRPSDEARGEPLGFVLLVFGGIWVGVWLLTPLVRAISSYGWGL